jgi:endonuclease VIII
MPEGPSIVILKEQVEKFEGKLIKKVMGKADIDQSEIIHQKIIAFKTWGKHLLICLPSVTIRIHLLMFGSYAADEPVVKHKTLKLYLGFSKGSIAFYTCSVKMIKENLDDVYDWSADVMNDDWSPAKAIKKLKLLPDVLISDALLNQEIFSGVGNIIKNEVLYRSRVHPESVIGKIPLRKLKELAKEARAYSFDFLAWKKKDELKKHWLAYSKKECKRCNLPLQKKYVGKTKRQTFFCNNCQQLYA